MKRAIFLLALCAFQTVFADWKKDMENLREQTIVKRKSIEDKLHSDMQVAINDARYGGVNIDVLGCWQEFKNLKGYLESDHCTRYFDKCHTKSCKMYYKGQESFAGEAFQYAEGCYNKYIIALEKEEQKYRFRARNCVLDHVKMLYGVKNGYVHERL